MFGFDAAAMYASAVEMRLRRKEMLESMDPEMRVEYLKAEEKAEQEATIERRHRELCASIERAGKNACFW
jgi:hypothetical protein